MSDKSYKQLDLQIDFAIYQLYMAYKILANKQFASGACFLLLGAIDNAKQALSELRRLQKENIKFAKAVLKRHHESYQAKVCMQERKHSIKALRKQIAMRPISYGDHWKCPRCGRAVHYDYCKDCGQKLRWQE